MTNSIILIPARLASTRLPGKPLVEMGGLPMVCQVVNRAREANLGEVIVATDSDEVKGAVEAHGAKAVMTGTDHQSGSDRIWEALQIVDLDGKIEAIVNLQGDLPSIKAETIRKSMLPLEDPECDIATLAVEIQDEAERTNPNTPKVVGTPIGEDRLRALYFTRTTAPYGDGPHYHHIGLYTYRRSALERFVSLPPSTLEQREKLEQLRALENGMRIDVQLVDEVPHGVDTPEDLDAARAYFDSLTDR